MIKPWGGGLTPGSPKQPKRNDPSIEHYLFALNQLFMYNPTPNYIHTGNTNSHFTFDNINTFGDPNHAHQLGHYANHHSRVNQCLNVHCNDQYGFCIVTNIHHQLNIYVTDISAEPDAIFWSCQCQLPDGNCNVDTSLIDNVPVWIQLINFRWYLFMTPGVTVLGSIIRARIVLVIFFFIHVVRVT